MLLAGLVVVAALGGWAAFVTADYTRTEKETEVQLMRLVSLLEEHARRTIKSADLVLRQLEAGVDDRPLDGLENDPVVYRELVDMTQDLAQVGSLYVLDAEGHIVASSLQREPVPGDYADRAYFQAHRDASPGLFVGQVLVGRQTGEPFFSVSRAIRDDMGLFRGVVVAAIHANYFAGFYNELGLGNGGSAGIVRQDGAVLVREPALHDPVGQTVQGVGRGLDAGTPAGLYRTQSPFDQINRIVAHRLVQGYPLVVAASRTEQAAFADWRVRFMQTGVTVIVLVALAVALWLFGLRSLRRQQAMAEALLASREGLEQRVVERTTELAQAYQDLTRVVQHKNMLLSEVYHRVKNNLQQVDALVAMQTRSAPEAAREPLEDTRRRVAALGLVHQQIMQSADQATFSLRSLVGDLCESMAQALGAKRHGIALSSEAVALPIDLDVAVPLGLLINELVSNAFKHAFPEGQKGHISISVHGDGAGTLVLVVADDGIGYDPRTPDGPSISLQVITALTRQLGATLEVAADGGTRVTVVAPKAFVAGAAE